MTNSEEIFDIVNQRDEVIGQAPRSKVHAQNLLHRAAHIWIFNDRGEFLLQKRSATKDTYPNAWTSSVCGHVNAGENYLDAAMREVEEEIGLKNAPLEAIGYIEARAETAMEFTRLYRCVSNGPFVFPEEEISELRFLPKKDISALIKNKQENVAPVLRFLWSQYSAAI